MSARSCLARVANQKVAIAAQERSIRLFRKVEYGGVYFFSHLTLFKMMLSITLGMTLRET